MDPCSSSCLHRLCTTRNQNVINISNNNIRSVTKILKYIILFALTRYVEWLLYVAHPSQELIRIWVLNIITANAESEGSHTCIKVCLNAFPWSKAHVYCPKNCDSAKMTIWRRLVPLITLGLYKIGINPNTPHHWYVLEPAGFARLTSESYLVTRWLQLTSKFSFPNRLIEILLNSFYVNNIYNVMLTSSLPYLLSLFYVLIPYYFFHKLSHVLWTLVLRKILF